ncbi:MAG: UDP-N-acetylglucosamine 1-carboxyvinyltransferase [Lachnospiraceae bacterium]
MDSIHVRGGRSLSGEISVQGSKNAVLPIMAAAVLVKGVTVLRNCPDITDVRYMIKLLQSIGCQVERKDDSLRIDAGQITGNVLPHEYVSKMRSSVILMGALLGRTGEVALNYPGGCVIGKRPIDLHLEAFEKMGVHLEKTDEKLAACAHRLSGREIHLKIASVGATENVILAAVLAEGTTILSNAAREPEIAALCDFLKQCGAGLYRSSEGDVIVIEGVRALHSCEYRIPFDRIVAGTYLFGAMGTGGNICLRDICADQLGQVLAVIRIMGGTVVCTGDTVCLQAPSRPLSVPYVRTAVYPGFPTDLQSPLMTALCTAEGHSVVEETIFENRLRIVPELQKMGADIAIVGRQARINGTDGLFGTCVKAEELRGGAALVMAGLAAQGETIIYGREFIDRGYEDIRRDIESLGGSLYYEETEGPSQKGDEAETE